MLVLHAAADSESFLRWHLQRVPLDAVLWRCDSDGELSSGRIAKRKDLKWLYFYIFFFFFQICCSKMQNIAGRVYFKEKKFRKVLLWMNSSPVIVISN